jgi:hypothetical protein
LWTYWSDSETYVIQGNGRGSRLDLEDRKMLEQGLITTEDLSTWKKPYNTVGILFFEDSIESDKDQFIDFIIQSREQGFDPMETVYSGSGSSTQKPNPFGKTVAKKQQHQSALEVAVNIALEKALKDEEIERIRNMSTDDLVNSLIG